MAKRCRWSQPDEELELLSRLEQWVLEWQKAKLRAKLDRDPSSDDEDRKETRSGKKKKRKKPSIKAARRRRAQLGTIPAQAQVAQLPQVNHCLI